MKKKCFLLIALFAAVFLPFLLTAQDSQVFRQEGIASWYGREFEGRPTASGEIFDSSQFTAAHPALPFGTMLVVTNLNNNKSVTVRVNDRGPFVPMRIIDVSQAAAQQLDMIITGTAPVSIHSVERIAMITAAVGVQIEPQTVVSVADINSPDASAALPREAVPEIPVQMELSPVQTGNAPVVSGGFTMSGSVGAQVRQVPETAVRLTPEIIITSAKNYRLQVGSFTNARNAVDAFERLKNSGLDPAYERFVNNSNVEFYRVVVAGISGDNVQSAVERIRAAGFYEALIREEN